ncbi:iron-sulfur cluster assembly protein [Chloropicon primus]|uniref:Iron-sulfur cluster assembly protein n=1 Tax=Chloropicon primus TaxID=1764295 RepID=A0A5B8MKC3_9CHLO|nr:iron-sulfur cluster assembly protein [Chloropicon primus]UPQ99022.1 iron-sulfur cluster assembly protein [Chloropicon primus]|eukprot:QDZ19812.1 iron-sulfur cluster assembly protein [Chloropicon primus]
MAACAEGGLRGLAGDGRRRPRNAGTSRCHVACRASGMSEWLEKSCEALQLRRDALESAPAAPWSDLRNKNKDEDWRFSASHLARIMGDQPNVLGGGEWASTAERSDLSSLASELAEDLQSDPRFNYRQVLVKDGVLVSEPQGEGGVVVTTASGVEGEEAKEAMVFLSEHEALRREDPLSPEDDFFDHLGNALGEGQKAPHLVLHARQVDESSGATNILHVFQVVPRKKEGSTVCWSPKTSVLVEGNQKLVLIEELVYEDGQAAAVEAVEPTARIVLPKTRAYLHPSASFKHTVVHSGAKPRDVNVRTIQVTQEEGSSYDMLETRVACADGSFQASASNASLSRVEVDMWQLGGETKTNFNSLSLIATSGASNGKGSKSSSASAGITHELRTKARLCHPGGQISQVAKMVASGGSSHCIFDGKVDIERYAQETDAAQIARGLLLTKRATINARPNLRIQADNVVASHGCTIADLEEEQLFYLASRGLDERTARSVLTGSFIREITQLFTTDEDMPMNKLAGRLDEAVEEAFLLCEI